MKTAVGSGAKPTLGGWVAGLLIAVSGLPVAPAASTDYLFDESERSPEIYRLDAPAARQAKALAHFVTGVFEEESAGPEKALGSYRAALAIDPGFTRLAVEVAYDYLRRGDATAAIGVLKDAHKARPRDPEPALALASVYLRHLRKPDLANRYAETALKLAPTRLAPYESLWEIAVAQDDRPAAQRVIARALKAKSTDANYWIQLADFLANTASGDTFKLDDRTREQLTTCLTRAAEFVGEDASLLARIADFHVLCRQFDDAAAFYARAADLRPNLPNINERLAGTLIELGRKPEAIVVLERIIAANSLDLAAYDQLYRLYEEQGQIEKALKNVELAIIIDRNSFVRQRDLMVLLLQAGRFEEASERAAEAGRIFPRSPFFPYVEARALTVQRRYDAALVAFERAAVAATSDETSALSAAFYYDYGCTAQLAGHPVKAAELFRKTIELDPRNPDAYNALGYMWAERGEHLDEAERLIRKALSFDPGNGAYLDSLGWVFYQRGDHAAALEQLLRAVKALPEPDPVVHEHVGDTYRALGRAAEALFHWQKAAQLDPQNKALAAKIDAAVAKVAEKKP